MNEDTDSFLNNECMEAIIELSNKYTNDMDLGNHVRAFILKTTRKSNQMALQFPKEEK